MIWPLSQQKCLRNMGSPTLLKPDTPCAGWGLSTLLVVQPLLSKITSRTGRAGQEPSLEETAICEHLHPKATGCYASSCITELAVCAPVAYTPACTIGRSHALEVGSSNWPMLLSTPWAIMVLALVVVGVFVVLHLAVRIKRKPKGMSYSVSRDQLTGLANRSTLIRQIEAAIRDAKRDRRSALLLIDIDDFRMLNDTLSYGAGDEVLVQVAGHIADQVREEDFVARFGEDAFAVLARTPTLDQAIATAERIRESLENMKVQMGAARITTYLTVSIGVSEIDGNSSVKDVALRADSALCAAKDSGRNRVVCLSRPEECAKDVPDAYVRIAMIEDALKNDRFILHFQPIIPIVAFNRCSDDSTQLTSSEHDNALKWVGGKGKARLYEALIRIEGDDGNVVPPGEFIPWAEAIGLIPQVDLWVLKNVIATLHERPDMNIAMNLSARSISRSSFLAQVEKCVSRSGLAPGRLGFEITETAGLGNLKAVRNWMKHMKALGCCFAIDDFGSGYASMAYLSNLPVDIVKIAGSIVRSMSSSPSGRLIVEAISSVVHVTGAWAVAESVEDQETLSTLREMGVDFAQGFYIARPSALDAIARHAPR